MTASGHASGAVVVGVTAATTIVAGIAVLMRLFTRVTIVRRFGTDDVCIAIAMILSVALTITMSQQVVYGMGRHYDTLTDNDKLRLMQWFWASVWIYYSSLCFTKVSILLQYLRVFPGEKFRRACYALMAIIVAYSLATFLTSVFACVPVESFWNPAIKGTCVNLKAVWFTNACINIVTDICTGVLPIPTLNSLNLPRRQRYALIAVFALGGFTCIVSILRLQSLYIVSESDDITWDNPLAAIWSSTETNVGIICSCLPTLKGCIARFFPRLFPTSNSGRNVSGRVTRIATLSHSGWQEVDVAGNEIELDGGSEHIGKSQVQITECDEGIREVDSRSTENDQYRQSPNGYHTWLPSDRRDNSQGSDIIPQHSRPSTLHQMV